MGISVVTVVMVAADLVEVAADGLSFVINVPNEK